MINGQLRFKSKDKIMLKINIKIKLRQILGFMIL